MREFSDISYPCFLRTVNSSYQILGLIVDKENPEAKKLYMKLGFTLSGEKKLAGKPLEHLQYKKA